MKFTKRSGGAVERKKGLSEVEHEGSSGRHDERGLWCV
jgi:hypothetical protein